MEQHPRNFTTQTSRISQISAKLQNVRPNLPVRILIALLGVVACVLLSSTRYNLSIAIIPMVGDSCTPANSICGIADEQSLASDTPNGSQSTLIQTYPGSNETSLRIHSKIAHEAPIILSLEDAIYKIDTYNSCEGIDKSQKLNWTEAEQGLALGAYYYGFATTHIFGGRLAERSRWGPKWITATGLVGAAIINAVLPVTARLNFAAFAVLR